jgi:hypothetical protein
MANWLKFLRVPLYWTQSKLQRVRYHIFASLTPANHWAHAVHASSKSQVALVSLQHATHQQLTVRKYSQTVTNQYEFAEEYLI